MTAISSARMEPGFGQRRRCSEFASTQSALAEHGLDRLWHDARVHTLHDPVCWKHRALDAHFSQRHAAATSLLVLEAA